MSTLSKETIETPNSPVESASSQSSTQTQPSNTQLHSDAVSLEVPLKVHGSKVKEIVRGVTPHTEPFEEQTSSMIVFPHGGVVRMATSVNIGQMLVLTNLKTRQDAICRVVKVRTYSNTASYVEVEFTHRQPGYWGVYFESDAAGQASSAARPAATVSEPSASSPKPDATSSLPRTTLIQGKSESTFIPLGSQEDVQSTASSTSSARVLPGSAPTGPAVPKNASTVPVMPSQVASSSVSVSEERTNTQTNISRTKAASNVSRTQLEEEDASVAQETVPLSESSLRASTDAFVPRSESESGAEQTPERGRNWLLIAACGAVLFVLVGGGILLVNHKSADSSASRSQSSATSQGQAPASPVAETQNAQATVTPSSSRPIALPVAPVREAPVTSAASARPTREVAVESEPTASPEPVANGVTEAKPVPSVFGALNAHPVSSRQASSGPAAPVLEGTSAPATGTDALLGITSPAPPSSLPPPGFNANANANAHASANAPVPVGGRITEPKLLTRVLPLYPAVARQSHTQGDVVLQVVVEKSGNIGDVKVLSGPLALRQAAADAVHRWRYQPTLLDGQPITIQMSVTVHFQL